jgi:hypothetical protein
MEKVTGKVILPEYLKIDRMEKILSGPLHELINLHNLKISMEYYRKLSDKKNITPKVLIKYWLIFLNPVS